MNARFCYSTTEDVDILMGKKKKKKAINLVLHKIKQFRN